MKKNQSNTFVGNYWHRSSNQIQTAERREIVRLAEAIKWALGENGEFAQRKKGDGEYWWRTELRRRAGMDK